MTQPPFKSPHSAPAPSNLILNYNKTEATNDSPLNCQLIHVAQFIFISTMLFIGFLCFMLNSRSSNRRQVASLLLFFNFLHGTRRFKCLPLGIDSIERVLHNSEKLIVVFVSQVHRCSGRFYISGLSRVFLPFLAFVCLAQNEKFTFLCAFGFGIERKPLIKTFLVCGILLVEGEFFSSHSPKSFANLFCCWLAFWASSWNLFYRCFCFFPFVVRSRSILGSLYFIFAFSRNAISVGNLLINIFPLFSPRPACLRPNMRFTYIARPEECFEEIVREALGGDLHKMKSINFPPFSFAQWSFMRSKIRFCLTQISFFL